LDSGTEKLVSGTEKSRAKPMTDSAIGQIDIRGKLAHIDQMLADHDRKRREIRFAPWQLVVTGA
jgi:hypothetical protein